MAHRVFKNPYCSVGGVALSSHVAEAHLRYSADAPEDTAGAANTRSRLPAGLKDWSIALVFRQDYSANQVDATLFAFVGTSVAVELRPDTAVASATNPKYTGNAILTEYEPLGGSIGETQDAPVTLQGSGDLTRATA